VSEPAAHAGVCHALFAYDVGFAIDLDGAQRLLEAAGGPDPQRAGLRLTRRAPRHFNHQPPPLSVHRRTHPIAVARAHTHPGAEAVLYDFGVVSVNYRIPIEGPLESLLDLSVGLYEHPSLLADSRRLVRELLDAVRPAVSRPGLEPLVEDYLLFHLPTLGAGVLDTHRDLIARILRAEPGLLSKEEVDDALSVRVSYGPTDAAVIDWNGALLLGDDMDDARAVLEFANVELLELRFLDDQLDRALANAYAVVDRPRGLADLLSHRAAADLRRISAFQVDSALLFEGVNNALKLLGDQYLARLYRAAGHRLHLPDWDQSILRKLGTLETIYDKVSDSRSNRRMEVLEWIIILLIAFEVVMSLTGVW
jgi:hypothetical protein